MKKLIVISAFVTIAATAVSCKSKAKNEPPVAAPTAFLDKDVNPPLEAPLEPIQPADLGANSSGLGL